MTFKEGDFQIFYFEDDTLKWLYAPDFNEHETTSASFDYLSSKQIYITCCEKGLVKIWDSKKNIIREI